MSVEDMTDSELSAEIDYMYSRLANTVSPHDADERYLAHLLYEAGERFYSQLEQEESNNKEQDQ